MDKFKSLTLGEVQSPVNVLKEVLQIFNRRQKCKAAILSWLDGKHYYGADWIRITFEKLAEILGYCRETISRHMNELIEMGLLESQASHRFPKDTACEYQINQDRLKEILRLSRCEKIDDYVQDNSGLCANNPSTYRNTLNTLKKEQRLPKNEVEEEWDNKNEETKLSELDQSACLQNTEIPPTVAEVNHDSCYKQENQSTITTFAHNSNQTSSTNESTDREDALPLPSDEREEESMKIHEVRDTVGKLTPELKRLVVDFDIVQLRKALALYRQRQQKEEIRNPYSWLKKCLQQKWWQDKQAFTSTQTDARKDIPEPKPASERLTDEQKSWYERAIACGICLPAPIEELPIKMGLVCARVIIRNPRPQDPPFDILPIEKLVAEYPL